MATHSSILTWKIPWIEEPGGLCPWGCKESDMTKQKHQQQQKTEIKKKMFVNDFFKGYYTYKN